MQEHNGDPSDGLDSGVTLACTECDIAVVVVKIGADSTGAVLTCHGLMKPSTPVRCWRVYRQPPAASMDLGALYVDEPTCFTVRCVRPGAGWIHYEGRPLRRQVSQLLCNPKTQR
jgi:hypothetical protein